MRVAWRSCADDPPDVERVVLVFVGPDPDDIGTGYRTRRDGYQAAGAHGGFCKPPTHWAPLPEPPALDHDDAFGGRAGR